MSSEEFALGFTGQKKKWQPRQKAFSIVAIGMWEEKRKEPSR